MVVALGGRDQGVAPGQYAVFYDGAVCLASAVITEALDLSPGACPAPLAPPPPPAGD